MDLGEHDLRYESQIFSLVVTNLCRFLLFVYICIVIWDHISKKERVGILLTNINLLLVCACVKSVQWFEMKGSFFVFLILIDHHWFNFLFILNRVSEWLFSNFSAISWQEQVNLQWDDDEVRFVLDRLA
jgi:hypothetical protein